MSIQIPAGPVTDDDGSVTSQFIHLFNSIAQIEPAKTATQVSFEKITDESQSVIDDLSEKLEFTRFHGSKAAAGSFIHNLNENNIDFSLNFYTVTLTRKHYSDTENSVFTDFGDDTILAWTYQQ